MLNPQSPIPLYHQLADILLARVRSGEYPPGTRIPSENSLARHFSIGRPTARQAVDMLVRKRVLIRKRGSGTYVLPPEKEVDLLSLAGTISAFHKKGITVSTAIMEPIRRIRPDDDPENPFFEQNALAFTRLSRVGETPVLLEDLYLHTELFPGIEDIDLSGRSLSRLVEAHYYMRPTGGKQNFRIGYLSGKKAEWLGVSPSTPILRVKRFLHFEPAENGIFSELFCRTDQFVFSQVIGGV